MVFNIVLNLIGVISTSSVNALYPQYEYCSTFEYRSYDLGPSYMSVYNDYIHVFSKFDITVDANVYYNSSSDFEVKDIYIGLVCTYYVINGNNSYDEIEVYNMSFNITDSITPENIDNAYLTLTFDYGETLETDFYNPLNSRGPHTYGSYDMPNDYEAYNEVTYRYAFGFSGGFKTNLLQYINLSDGASYDNGYNDGYRIGYATGNNDGKESGYQEGYGDGYAEASNQDQTAVVIFTGICEVGLLPVNVFLGILNFEVFGINIGGLVASLMTVAIVVIVIRIVLGAKGGGDK